MKAGVAKPPLRVMKTTMKVVFALLLFLAAPVFGQWETTLPTKTFAFGELPKGGTAIAHPIEKKTYYYFGKGLYISTDEKRSWKMIQGDFDFENLFIHPKTGSLYAIIDCTLYRTNDKGFFTVSSGEKALKSEDGKNWTDITSDTNGYGLMNFFVDPDHPERVCMRANFLRTYIFQPKDDKYSSWKQFWPQQWVNSGHEIP